MKKSPESLRTAAHEIRGLKPTAPSAELGQLAGSMARAFDHVADVVEDARPGENSALRQIRGAFGASAPAALRPFSPAPLALALAGRGLGSCLRARCEDFLQQNPGTRLQVRALFKRLTMASPAAFEADETAALRTLQPGELPGLVSPGVDVALEILNLMTDYGAWATLGVVPLTTGKTKLVKITAHADAVVLTSANRGSTIPADASITGSSDQTDTPTIAARVEASREVVDDGRYSFESGLMEAIVNGLNRKLDHICFRADGTADTDDGGMTGIFAHGSVTNFSAAAGSVGVASLTLDDFAGVIGSVSAAALQRECAWWISPSFLAKLILLRDGSERLLKPPRTVGESWTLCGFPIVWTAAGPSEDGAAKQIAAFGRRDAYTVALRQQLELSQSEDVGFLTLKVLFRALIRAQATMRDAASFCILKTAAA